MIYEGEKAISKLRAAGASPSMIRFLRGEIGRGAELEIEFFEGGSPTLEQLEASLPLWATEFAESCIQQGETKKG